MIQRVVAAVDLEADPALIGEDLDGGRRPQSSCLGAVFLSNWPGLIKPMTDRASISPGAAQPSA